VNFPIGGRPILGGLTDNSFSAKLAMFPLSPIDRIRDNAYVGVIGYGGK
jgi:hypothetical protein